MKCGLSVCRIQWDLATNGVLGAPQVPVWECSRCPSTRCQLVLPAALCQSLDSRVLNLCVQFGFVDTCDCSARGYSAAPACCVGDLLLHGCVPSCACCQSRRTLKAFNGELMTVRCLQIAVCQFLSPVWICLLFEPRLGSFGVN